MLYEFLRLIGYGTVGAIAVFLIQQHKDNEKVLLDAKDAQIEQLKALQPSNAMTAFEDTKKFYQSQIDMYRQKITELESGKGSVQQIAVYRQKVFELETKLNLLLQVSGEVAKRMIDNLGPLRFDQVRPFAYFALFDSTQAAKYSFRSLYENWYYQFRIHGGTIMNIPLPAPNDWQGPYVTTGTHSPMYYSFDSVDLRTATFKKTDLRGVDLTDVLVDEHTRFPKLN